MNSPSSFKPKALIAPLWAMAAIVFTGAWLVQMSQAIKDPPASIVSPNLVPYQEDSAHPPAPSSAPTGQDTPASNSPTNQKHAPAQPRNPGAQAVTDPRPSPYLSTAELRETVDRILREQ